MASESYHIELRPGNVLLVRIPSPPFRGHPMPDAVFTFHVGDPQYDLWAKRYEEQLAKQQNDSVSNGQKNSFPKQE